MSLDDLIPFKGTTIFKKQKVKVHTEKFTIYQDVQVEKDKKRM